MKDIMSFEKWYAEVKMYLTKYLSAFNLSEQELDKYLNSENAYIQSEYKSYKNVDKISRVGGVKISGGSPSAVADCLSMMY